MTVQFMRIRMKCSELKTLEKFEKELDKAIDKDDMYSLPHSGDITISTLEDFGGSGYELNANLFVKDTIEKTKYKDSFMDEVNKFSDKGDTSGYVDVYDECSHDSDNPQPCVMTRILEWNGE